MRLGFSRHPNRSQQALDNSLASGQRGSQLINPAAAPVVPGDEDKGYDARSAQPPQTYADQRNDVHNYLPTNNGQGRDISAYQEASERPARSQSHRVTTGYPHLQPLPLVDDPRGGTVDDQALVDYGKPYSTSSNSRPQQPPPEQKKNKPSRSFFGFSKPNRAAEQPPVVEQQSSHNNTAGLGRRISIRHKEPPLVFPSQASNSSSDKQHQLPGWQSGQSSESQLPSPHEADEDDGLAGRYLIHQSEQDPERPLDQGHDQLQNPTIRLGGGDQDTTVRLVDEGWHHQYQQPPQILTQQQWIVQQNQNQQVANSPVAISPVTGQQQQQQQQTDYQQPNQQLGHYQTYPNPAHQAPISGQFRSATNPEVISQLSHDSPIDAGEEQRPVSVQSNTQAATPIGNYAPHLQSEYPPRGTSIQGPQGPRPLGQQPTMPQQQSASAPNRRSTDAKQALQADTRNSGPPPSYSQQQFPGQNQGPTSGSGNPLPPTPQLPPGSSYRGSSLQREYGQSGGAGDQGRSTPPLPGERDRELTEMDKLVIKYKKVKGLYFEKLTQVEQLQNTLANQRLSQSRTSLDDSEYATRFNRLDGAIKEIAFSIRKDWKTIPRWLVPYVNQDAQKTGTKEMTAVGRAAISRWIAEEIFHKCFHPGLEIALSSDLKKIEQNIRHFASPLTNQEESEALNSKVVQWKLGTVEGLGYRLNSADSLESRAMFTQMSVSNLTAHLIQHLRDPAPEGIEGNATSIIELAIGIACHLPLESRDISISYPLPGDPVLPTFKVEAPLPPLDNPGPDPSVDGESGSIHSDPKDADNDTGKGDSSSQKITKKPQDKGKNMMAQLQSQNSTSGKKMPGSSTGGGEPGQDKGKDRGDGTQKVRFALFVGVEVRGRQWLVNPPVWTM